LDVTISKKGKIAIAVFLVLAAAPLYIASNPGMDRIVKGLWDKADDPKTPETLVKIMWFYGITWRDDKMETLAHEWLKHYGGDETEKDKGQRYDSWDALEASTFPFDAEHKRPEQKGEDYRPTPHPLTGKVLIMWANHLEDGHQLQQAVHIYELLDNEAYCTQWNLQRDPEVMKAAQAGRTRNGSGSRSF